MGKKLTDEEIKRRLIEGRNFKKLHAQSRIAHEKLKVKYKSLEAEFAQFKAESQAALYKRDLELAELRQAVFGKKKPTQSVSQKLKPISKKPASKRSSSSYRRPLPNQDQITQIQRLNLDEKCSCGGHLVQTAEEIRFIEDIPLAELTEAYQAKLVTQQIVAKGKCQVCKKKVVAANYDLGGQRVRLGQNVRLLVIDLIARAGLSYAKVTQLIKTLYGLEISTGEIAKIMMKTHLNWLPEYFNLQAQIRASPALHIDETSWPIQAINRYGQAWVMSAENNQTMFALKDSRGVAHAQELLKGFKGVRITDNYSAYSNKDLMGKHQICWAHLFRHIRDLESNSNLAQSHRAYVSKWHEDFCQLYLKLMSYLEQAKPKFERLKQIKELQADLAGLIESHPPKSGEPEKLTKFKAQLQRANLKNKLFVCLEELVPADNNRAERDLRPLVIKRKISFGSKTEKGANALATVMSLCISTYRKHPNNYFKALSALG